MPGVVNPKEGTSKNNQRLAVLVTRQNVRRYVYSRTDVGGGGDGKPCNHNTCIQCRYEGKGHPMTCLYTRREAEVKLQPIHSPAQK
jgi:hypothetical protein